MDGCRSRLKMKLKMKIFGSFLSTVRRRHFKEEGRTLSDDVRDDDDDV